MKLEVYKEREEGTVQLRLQKSENGRIHVVALDDNGGIKSYLVTFMPNGKLFLQRSVDEALGFELDEDERIVIDKF